ncbi:hypothetical protein [Rhodopirellula europaea]|uniref:hypothetical protein n=1 Tax=Rhodopirellula europaea TaxID=1263866 RepID=UPI0030EC294E
MTQIEFDDITAEALREAAERQNMSVAEFVRVRLLILRPGVSASGHDASNFDTELNGLLFAGSTLPSDFSRADIYSDHD